ncbi:alpha/beta hydrolase [Curtobacterium sp. MCSS17_016]|uniref:alpha/beta fold hydrolase n=1 Tax=Curtobacterium sp. MCSS17_016 TaxID=2175644 RepID=UPI000DA95F4B|nr:alpha/beta hydrolase [Curtobacterium sp. MCSS17_016]WIE81464.1 alpha/beta hydrolase [Curtobacterium sp. MCSS17_016]
MLPVVFLHASNRPFERAWPVAAGLSESTAAVMPGYAPDEEAQPFSQDRWEEQLLDACGDGAIVVAHSFGGPVAMRAAARAPERVLGLILLEPAAYALAVDQPAVADHIARVQPVLARAATMSPAQFIAAFQEAVTGTPATTASEIDVLAASRQQRLPGPWTLDTPRRTGVPTLVVTGGWNAEYEAIADTMTDVEHIILTGHGHRPQDHPDLVAVARDFIERVTETGAASAHTPT